GQCRRGRQLPAPRRRLRRLPPRHRPPQGTGADLEEGELGRRLDGVGPPRDRPVTPDSWSRPDSALSGSRRRPILWRSRPDPAGQDMLTLQIARGRSLPLGASSTAEGVNFSLLCRHGTAVFLVLYPLEGDDVLAEIALHPRRNRTGDHWHVLVN